MYKYQSHLTESSPVEKMFYYKKKYQSTIMYIFELLDLVAYLPAVATSLVQSVSLSERPSS